MVYCSKRVVVNSRNPGIVLLIPNSSGKYIVPIHGGVRYSRSPELGILTARISLLRLCIVV